MSHLRPLIPTRLPFGQRGDQMCMENRLDQALQPRPLTQQLGPPRDLPGSQTSGRPHLRAPGAPCLGNRDRSRPGNRPCSLEPGLYLEQVPAIEIGTEPAGDACMACRPGLRHSGSLARAPGIDLQQRVVWPFFELIVLK